MEACRQKALWPDATQESSRLGWMTILDADSRWLHGLRASRRVSPRRHNRDSRRVLPHILSNTVSEPGMYMADLVYTLMPRIGVTTPQYLMEVFDSGISNLIMFFQ